MSPCQSCTGRAELYLCRTCANELRAMLRSLAHGPVVAGRRTTGLLDALDDVALGRTRMAGTSGHRQRGDEQPALYDPDTENNRRTKQAEAADLATTIANGLSTTVRDLCDARAICWRPVRSVEPGFIGPLPRGWRRLPTGYVATVLDAAEWLAAHTGTIACSDSAGHVHDEIRGYVRRIVAIVDRPARRIWLGPCPTWNEQTRTVCGVDLYAREDAIEVYCRTCHRTHNCNRMKLLQQNDLERELLTWARLMKANRYQPDEYRIPTRTLRMWRDTGRLRPRGWLRPNGRHGGTQHSTDDEPLYRWSDVRRLRAEKPQRAHTGAAAHKR